jgi:hypothetical protein
MYVNVGNWHNVCTISMACAYSFWCTKLQYFYQVRQSRHLVLEPPIFFFFLIIIFSGRFEFRQFFDYFDIFLTTFWQLFDRFLTTFWQDFVLFFLSFLWWKPVVETNIMDQMSYLLCLLHSLSHLVSELFSSCFPNCLFVSICCVLNPQWPTIVAIMPSFSVKVF